MSSRPISLLQRALGYRRAGLCVLPANLGPKCPALTSWKEYQQRLPSEDEVRRWFGNGQDALCIVTGAVSGNAEMIDFDVGGELYPAWADLVEARCPGLVARLARERSQSGGKHVIYRTEAAVPGSLKLAQRVVECPNGSPVTIAGKTYVPRRVGGRWIVLLTLIETKGEGGLFLCAPSPGYVIEDGSFENLPVLTADERTVLIECARALTEVVEEPHAQSAEPAEADGPARTEHTGGRPGDGYNARGDIRPVLKARGWTLVRPGDNELWRRPGKERAEIIESLQDTCEINVMREPTGGAPRTRYVAT